MMRYLFALAVVSVVAGCATPGMGGPGMMDALKQATGSKEYTEPEEIELGQALTSGLLGAAPLVQNERVQRYVNQVGRWVASQSERPDLPWAFGVLDNENVNAFAAPGGYILMTNGLLKKLNTESELAGVLAHEIAHVVQRHQLEAINKETRAGLGKAIGAAWLEQKAGKSALGQAANQTGLTSAAVNLITDGFYARPLDRSWEYEADRMAVVLAARAGYDPFGLVNVLQVMQASKASEPGLALLLKTHPQPDDRLQQLEKVLGSLTAYEKQDQGRQRFQMAMGRASETVYTPVPQPASEATPAARKPAPARKPATKKPG